ncbi:hypothetical protein AVEN_197788-1 [Araneus ventricosus]|uniref:Uncharacterized protein n=1 Tax=Araneus ventricosus TaxID=182803 RepID=A0A4Y2HN87_ARAVE|nr:hypothetical protein AVEN_197788-1 [Araneus ventricosus]
MSNTEALQWAAEVDYSLARNEILTDDEIIRTVTAEDDDDDDDVTPVNPVKISHSEAVAVLNTSLQWAEEQNFEAHENMPLRRLRGRAKKIMIFLDTDYNHSLTYVVIMFVHIMFRLYHVHSIYPYNPTNISIETYTRRRNHIKKLSTNATEDPHLDHTNPLTKTKKKSELCITLRALIEMEWACPSWDKGCQRSIMNRPRQCIPIFLDRLPQRRINYRETESFPCVWECTVDGEVRAWESDGH